jgi:diguanylate cyclase (GGDEF)-like protein/hemerythrin-like metal-binding protein
MHINEAVLADYKPDEATYSDSTQKNPGLRDPLTGLPNRDLFIDRMNQELARERRYERGFALMMINLNTFGPINEENGQSVGDSGLRNVAKLLISNVRDIDTVARMRGEEFAVLLNGVSSKREAEIVARKIINSISAPIQLENGTVLKISAKVGIVLSPQDGNQPEQLMLCAIHALNAAKSNGNNLIGFNSTATNPEPAPAATPSDSRKLGISIIDAQHTAMANYIQGILDSLSNGDKSIKLEKRVELLIELCQIHFQTEEDLMRRHNLPDCEEHHAEHQQLLNSLRAIFRNLNFNDLRLEKFALEINEWLSSHIRGQDAELSAQLKLKGVS